MSYCMPVEWLTQSATRASTLSRKTHFRGGRLNRNQRPGPARPGRPATAPPVEPDSAPEQHSGEGSASALARLRRIEDSRIPSALPGEPPKEEADPAA